MTTAFLPSAAPMAQAGEPIAHRFDPYESNGGTILSIAGKDFSVISGDTRQSQGYSIQTRYAQKVFPLTSKVVIAVNGFAADGNHFVKRLKQRLEWYEHAHHKEMPVQAVARLVQTMLYARRMFPYYVYVILGGVDQDGVGAVYAFDPVGSYERTACIAYGAAQSLLQPFLDNQIYFRNQTPAPGEAPPIPGNLPLATVLGIVCDAFTSATERHIEVGDCLELIVVLAAGRTTDDLVAKEGQASLLPEGMTVELIQDGSDDAGTGKEGPQMYKITRPLKRD